MHHLKTLAVALALVLFASHAATQDLSQLQAEYAAVETVHQSMADAQQKIDGRTRAITDYLNQNDLMKDYQQSHAPNDTQLADLPMSYDDALKSALQDVGTPDGLPPSTIADPGQLRRLISATKELDEQTWNRLYPKALQLAHMVAFLKDNNQWDAMNTWVGTQQEAHEQALQQQTEARFKAAHDEAIEEDKEGQKRVQQANEQAWQRTLDHQQQKWEQNMAEYNAETDRIQAEHTYNTPYPYYYGGDNVFWPHRHHRVYR
ncbi:MAG: hypothetical protein AAGI54_04915 [Planctomycetota bacterium]